MKRNANLKTSFGLHAIVTFEKQSIILIVAIIVMRTWWKHCRENQNTWPSQLIKMYLEDKQIDLLNYLATLSWSQMKCTKYARKTLMLPINFCCHNLLPSPILVLTIYLAASRIVKSFSFLSWGESVRCNFCTLSIFYLYSENLYLYSIYMFSQLYARTVVAYKKETWSSKKNIQPGHPDKNMMDIVVTTESKCLYKMSY